MTERKGGPMASGKSKLQSQLLMPGEADVHRQLFKQQPIRILEKYLECFDDECQQIYDVPEHVLSALAKCFHSFMRREQHKSLDAAFGGSTRRQLTAIRSSERSKDMAFEILVALENIKVLPEDKREPGSPFEVAVEMVAESQNMSPDNVRRLYKLSKPK